MIKINLGRVSNIPVTFKYAINQQHWDLIVKFIPFQNWTSTWSLPELQTDKVKIKSLEIEDISFFGERIGFLKFRLDARWKSDDKPIPGIVFMRGDAVAVLIVIKERNSDNSQVVMVQQPRIPVPSLDFLELPAGMVDEEKNFHSVALKELKEECGIEIFSNEMIPLGPSDSYLVSPGGCDEKLSLYLVEKVLSPSDIKDLDGRLGGLREEGERIQVRLINLSEVVEKTRSLSVLAAMALYQHHKAKSL